MASIRTYEPWHKQDAVRLGLTSAGLSGCIGLFVAAAQNSLSHTRVGPMGIFTRSGSTIAIFTAVGGLYPFARAVSSNLREKNDPWNSFNGGFTAGLASILKIRTLPGIVGFATALGFSMAIFDWAGNSLQGLSKDDMSPDKNPMFSVTKRVPREQTLRELGLTPATAKGKAE